MPGVHAGALYAFMVSFADVPISMFLTAPGFVTYPVELFFGIETDFNPSVLASASLVIVFSLLLLLAVQRVIGLDNVVRSK
jgi:putative spermidine/putrescine transport system permease protein